jgi:hypothetical protein
MEQDAESARALVKEFLGISARVEATSSQKRAESMTEPDILSHKIRELKEWQSVAWRRVADPLVTAFERREIRNHIKESNGELRYYLGMLSERLRFQVPVVEDVGDSLANLSSDFLRKDSCQNAGRLISVIEDNLPRSNTWEPGSSAA